MEIIRTVEEMQERAGSLRVSGRMIGFVPTMGALHEGHLSLIDRVRERVDVVVVSIYVNPTQFAPHEDFAAYPRGEDRDLDLCRARGADIAFVPSTEEIYPPGFSTYITEEAVAHGLESSDRPHFFRGVCTVVAKLFNIVRPDIAVFGQKDAQQAAVIQRMVRDLAFPVEVDVAPTAREPDGLAMSSRNAYLTAEERERARVLSKSLFAARAQVSAGERSPAVVLGNVLEQIADADGVELIYAVAVNRLSMQAVDTLEPGETILAVAARVGRTRLIDNVLL